MGSHGVNDLQRQELWNYLKLQGRFGHLHAEHIATLQKFANAQWKMMGVQLPEALLRAADAKNLSDMASAEAAAAIAQTV